ncbi:MAG TPA: folate-binding protein [Aquabacterium sp.]|nr:folate-binding protein [Aquabacterium sp.]
MSLPTPLRGAARLTDWGVIRAHGADAATFLHSQLTQDIEGLGPSEARLAGYCSAKGRLLASFIVWRPAPDEVLLACSADLLAPTLKRLSMFVLRAKCRLSDASAERLLYGIVGEAVPAAHGAVQHEAGRTLIRLADAEGQPRALLVQPADAAPPALPALDLALWNWLEVRSGVARIVAHTVEQFVPQMVNLEAVGGVNFKKGCYPGQEIVARSQYRGTLKRRAMLFDSEAELQPGQEVFHSDDPGQPAGLVANAARGPGGTSSALIEVKLAALAGGSWHAGSADGPLLRPQPLPYALPTEA